MPPPPHIGQPWVGGDGFVALWLEQTRIKLNSALTGVRVEVGDELDNMKPDNFGLRKI